jgi:hypothetical protein
VDPELANAGIGDAGAFGFIARAAEEHSVSDV